MKVVEVSLNGKEVGFRLTSGEILSLEEKTKKSITDLLQDVSVTMCVTLIKHMRRWEVPNFSHSDALALVDELIDNGYSYQRIYWDIFAPVCVNAGVIEQSALDNAKKETSETKN